ncbi:MAG: ATP-binding protein [Crenarchaeota archaeon]|nr:ATP-binding protein [Thermoproteota archaeon]MCR8454123.1 ATP-binding protein [Thermoproteota archaeon]MCR8455162.1 ATP-binding protein [Thermoproteota archaeon]MCR8463709.1 ATP-binding protein [Thermoproteota archaeon]MCR8471268.1 ATP-binding protein [Thermoproteota archaeon]
MGFYDEALKYKKLAEEAIKKGDLEAAKRYLQIAISRLEELEKVSEDITLKKIWEQGKKNLMMLLEGIESGTIKAPKKPVVAPEKPQELPKAPKAEVAKTSYRETWVAVEIPEECRAEFLYTSIPDIAFKDVAGLDIVKQELREAIEWQIKYSDILEQLGLRPLKGVLLYGPPGTGKTYIVKAAAGEFKVPLIIVDPATLMSKWLGESEKMVAKIFDCARRITPAIVFIDEVDKVFPKTVSSSDAPKRIEAQLLQELDGIKSGEGFIVVFATNEPWNINPALIRAKRVDKVIYIPPPDDELRRKLFNLYLSGVKLAEDVNIDEIVKRTEPNAEGYYSAAAIALICNEAKKNVMRDYQKTGEIRPINMKDLLEAIEKIRRDIPQDLVEKYEKWRKQYFTEIG